MPTNELYFMYSVDPYEQQKLKVNIIFNKVVIPNIVIENFLEKIKEHENNYNWFLEELRKQIRLSNIESEEKKKEIENLFKENIDNYYLEYLLQVQQIINQERNSSESRDEKSDTMLDIAIDSVIAKVISNLEDENCNLEQASHSLIKIAEAMQNKAEQDVEDVEELKQNDEPTPIISPERFDNMNEVGKVNLTIASIMAVGSLKLNPPQDYNSNIEKDNKVEKLNSILLSTTGNLLKYNLDPNLLNSRIGNNDSLQLNNSLIAGIPVLIENFNRSNIANENLNLLGSLVERNRAKIQNR